MKAVVVYESLWGNTAAVARAIAEGIGPGAVAMSTAEATPEAIAGASLIVAGAPIQGFSLPTDRMRAGVRTDTQPAPDLSAPTLRSWLEHLPAGHGRSAAFDTKIRWSPGSAASVIDRQLAKAGYPPVVDSEHFIVAGQHGPLREGELERARLWGGRLAPFAS
ncbi:MAG: flavodoxin [Chloroflexi bacterium]|nr:flavodoxin [Chloroflexota bacterium]